MIGMKSLVYHKRVTRLFYIGDSDWWNCIPSNPRAQFNNGLCKELGW